MTKTLSARRVEIAWPDLGITVTAELGDRNPELADALWESLPYQSLQGHGLVAGQHLYHVAPIPSLVHLAASYRMADRREAPDGTVFCSALQHLGIKYGTVTEPMPASPVGRIRPEDMPALSEAGHAVWDSVYATKKPVPVEVRGAGMEGGHSIPRLTAADPDANHLLHDVYAETERIWLSEPLELADLHRGWIPASWLTTARKSSRSRRSRQDRKRWVKAGFRPSSLATAVWRNCVRGRKLRDGPAHPFVRQR
ncbi:hypothetical protein [Streptomyces fodineus]|uniref:hypothetical protein n=1 Tax=Streptomyces fodineus TaxID=1904616 RepID=UPI001D03E9C0|nr:hypothetical protein [Streptomyces fodineus]